MKHKTLSNKKLISHIDNSASNKYNNIFYQNAFRFAYKYIDKQFSNKSDFKWLKCDSKSVSFDDLTFKYKNNVFSVLLRIFYNGKSILCNEEEEIYWVDTAENNDMVPIIFPIVITDDAYQYEVCSGMSGLDFWDWMTTDKLNPIKIASDKQTPISHYELLNIAITEVVSLLQKKKIKICSWCDHPGQPDYFPKIAFENEKGELCWIIVKYGINGNIEDLTAPYLHKMPSCSTNHDIYFAPIIFEYDLEATSNYNEIKIKYLDNVITKIYEKGKNK